jgi:hypothetical protein
MKFFVVDYFAGLKLLNIRKGMSEFHSHFQSIQMLIRKMFVSIIRNVLLLMMKEKNFMIIFVNCDFINE